MKDIAHSVEELECYCNTCNTLMKTPFTYFEELTMQGKRQKGNFNICVRLLFARTIEFYNSQGKQKI